MKSFGVSAIIFTTMFAMAMAATTQYAGIQRLQLILSGTNQTAKTPARQTFCQNIIDKTLNAIVCNNKTDAQVAGLLSTWLQDNAPPTTAAPTKSAATTRAPITRVPTTQPQTISSRSDADLLAELLEKQGEKARGRFCACTSNCQFSLPDADARKEVCNEKNHLSYVIEQLKKHGKSAGDSSEEHNVTIISRTFAQFQQHNRSICSQCLQIPNSDGSIEMMCPKTVSPQQFTCSVAQASKVGHIFFQEKSTFTSIAADAFVAFPNLKTISIINGSIANIANDAFKGLKNLETLILSGNKLETFNTSALYDNDKLRLLALDSNPIRCGCNVDHSINHEINAVIGTCKKNATVMSIKGELFGCHKRIVDTASRSSSSSTNVGLIAGGCSLFVVAVVIVIALKRRQIRALPKRFQTMNSFTSHGGSELYDQDQAFKSSEKMENPYANV